MGFFDWLYYGPPKRKEPAWKRDEKLTRKPDKDKVEDKPIPPASDKELKTVLHIKKIDLNIAENTKAHRTDKYECTEDRETEEGSNEPAELVIRRGQPFRITCTFDRPFSCAKDDLKLIFRTGEFADKHSATHGKITVDESGKTKYKCDTWAANLISKKGNDAVIEINSPATIAIGEWTLTVDTITQIDKCEKHYQYTHPDDIFVIFNPWCKDDQTYMRDEKLLNEYALNDHGCVYRGNQYSPKAKPWNFGQFEDRVLEGSLFIIRKCFRPKQQYKLGDPVQVARAVAQVVNCCDSDNGVLWGNWSGNYSDGLSPSHWTGSVKILLQYLRTGQPVKYGQCWVFSGVTTTVCRAIGLPARSVTNFASAHDTDNSCTIDKNYDQLEDGSLQLSDCNSDSVWNFHVWNDVWMARPDLVCKKNEFDGWQAIDATPQEQSDGIFTCGPAPLYAIKHGYVDKQYDSAFIFSEVNADEVHWKNSPSGPVKFKVKQDKIGKCMSTKKPDGELFDAGAWFASRFREDVTGDYKYEDETDNSRRAVLRAALGARNPKDAYSKAGEHTDVIFKLLHDADLYLGQDVEVKLSAKNTNKDYRRKVKAVTFNFQRQTYTGEIVGLIKSEKLPDEVRIDPGATHVFTVILKHDEYQDQLEEEKCMCIQAYAIVKKKRRCPMESCVKSHDVEFGDPELKVKLPKKIKKGDEFEATITFDNPLSKELTNCRVQYESGGAPHKKDLQQDNVPSMKTYTGKFMLKAKRKGKFTVTFQFDSKELRYITGSAGFTVE